jgi:MerR family transcriptional regulator, heat shock protein HspR
MQEERAEISEPERRNAMTVPRPDDARGVYGISVAAELVGMGVQTLRLYEARGLLDPERTGGGTRRYSTNDLDRIRRIGDLLEAGLNLAGIAMVMDLQDENTQLRAEREEQQWLPTASIRASRPPKRTSSSSKPRSTRR